MKSLFLGCLCLVLSSCALTISPQAPKQTPSSPIQEVARSQPHEMKANDQAATIVNLWCMSAPRTVRTANPTPLLVKDDKARALKNLTDSSQSFGIGDSCQTGAGWWQGLGQLSAPLDARVLVRYWNPAPRAFYFSCPSTVLFTISIDEFLAQCALSGVIPLSAKEIKEQEAQERALIELLLKAAP